MKTNELEGKGALVTGASKGIGRQIAIRLAEKGARIAVNYNSSPDAASEVVETLTDSGAEAFAVQADVSDIDQVKAMFKEVEGRWGNVDILVNNAGIIDDRHLIRMSDDSWHRVIDVNLNGTFYCTRAAIRKMMSKRWGRVINIGSIVGLRGNPTQTNYTASKAAVIGFTKALAKEVASRNVTANVVTRRVFRDRDDLCSHGGDEGLLEGTDAHGPIRRPRRRGARGGVPRSSKLEVHNRTGDLRGRRTGRLGASWGQARSSRGRSSW